MKYITATILILVGIFSSLFGKQEKQQETEALSYRLTWFELQVAPFVYRFAIIPEQPILIGLSGEGEEKGFTMLIRYNHVPELYEKTVERVDEILKRCGVENLPLHEPNAVFAENTLTGDSVHLRFAYADGKKWAGYYSIGDIPKEVVNLISETKLLAKEIDKSQSSRLMEGAELMSHLKVEKNQEQKSSPEVILKIRIRTSGAIFRDGHEVSFEELEASLDHLKQANGQVWYYRDNPTEEPSEQVNNTIKKVLDAVVERELPIHLQREEY